MKETKYFTKVPDTLFRDLQLGELSFLEFSVLVYLMGKADKNTGIAVASSASLSFELNDDRKRISNAMSRLKRKGRIKIEDSSKTQGRRKKRRARLYEIYICDYMTIPVKDNQKATRSQPGDVATDKQQTSTRQGRVAETTKNKQSSGGFEIKDAPADKIRTAADKDKEKRGSVAFDYESLWKEAVKGISETNKGGTEIIFNATLRMFEARPGIYNNSRGDQEDTANDLSVGLSLEEGWRIFEPAEKARNPYRFLRKMAKPGHEWSRGT